jgi:hypothetical protein
MAKKFSDLAGACWKGYKAVGLKDKNGKKVPNCVPEEVQMEAKKDEEETVDRVERSDYKVSPTGRKSHKQIVFKMGEEELKEEDDYSKRHTVVAHVSDNTGTPADGEKREVIKKALSVLAATPKHAELAARKHFADKGYKVHKIAAKLKEEFEEMEESTVPAKNTDIADKSYLKDMGKKPTIKSDLKNFKNFLTGKKETNEEVEQVMEAAPFKTKEDAVKYAKEKVKTHRDNLDGIEIYAHSGGFDVNHTMNSSGRNSLQKIKAKHLGTIYKEEVEQVEEGWYEKPASAYRRKGDEIGGGSSKAPVAPVPDKKYIKGTPENKAYKATKKPINGMPTNVKEEADQIDELNKTTLASYAYKAAADAADKARDAERRAASAKDAEKRAKDPKLSFAKSANQAVQKHEMDRSVSASKKSASRVSGVLKAASKLAYKEELEVDEAYSMDDVRRDAAAQLKKSMDKQSADRIAAHKNPPAKRGFLARVGQKQINMVKGAYKGLTKEETELDESVLDEKAPPGFEGTVKAMKKHKEIDNPYALAWYMKNKGMKSHKEEFDDNGELITNMKSYKEFLESLDEVKMSDLPSRKVSGKYGTEYYKGEAEKDVKGYDDEDKPAAPVGEKRGRGRPAGSTSGARQKGTIAKRKGSGVEMTGYPVHLPNFK